MRTRTPGEWREARLDGETAWNLSCSWARRGPALPTRPSGDAMLWAIADGTIMVDAAGLANPRDEAGSAGREEKPGGDRVDRRQKARESIDP